MRIIFTWTRCQDACRASRIRNPASTGIWGFWSGTHLAVLMLGGTEMLLPLDRLFGMRLLKSAQWLRMQSDGGRTAMAAVVEVPDGGPLRCLGFAGKNRCPSAWIVAGLGDGRRELADGAVRVGSLRLLPAGAPAGCLVRGQI
ncbi:hypothetical protein ACLOJK_036889 [Asimina triloba]